MSAAVFMRSGDNLREAMPQTVPSPRAHPCDFGDFAADAFDLSLLPAEPASSWPGGPATCEVPYSPCSPASVQQFMSLFCDAAGPAPPLMFEQDKAIKAEPYWEQDASVPQLEHEDHHLLREVLKDTSFQRKFNLKPFDLGGLASGLASGLALRRTLSGGSGQAAQDFHTIKMEEGELPQLDQDAIEPMISIAIQQMRNEIGNTCSMLGIAADPTQWTSEDVRAWVMWTVRQFSLPPVQLSLFDMEGAALATLSEQDITHRAPQSGSLLFAQLEIWKASCAEDMDCSRGASPVPAPAPPPSPPTPSPAPLLHQLEVPSLATPMSACSPHSQHSGHNSSASSADTSDDDDEDMESLSVSAGAATSSPGGSPASAAPSRGSSAHIHLWQFLKELLASPQLHGSCVRWLDRPAGVFKIEDSVRVARLWGARKNRPAMNYDKLSRSIRQYYKKGIMKKTERSQRLVYQFCHPYSL